MCLRDNCQRRARSFGMAFRRAVATRTIGVGVDVKHLHAAWLMSLKTAQYSRNCSAVFCSQDLDGVHDRQRVASLLKVPLLFLRFHASWPECRHNVSYMITQHMSISMLLKGTPG